METTRRDVIVGVFESRRLAQEAIRDLKKAGFTDDQIGVAVRGNEHDDDTSVDGGTHIAEGAMAGAAAGAGVGGLWALGIAAGLLPAIGPAIAGGILGSLLASAAAGAAAGGLAGSLIGMGVPEDEAEYYDTEFQSGRTIVTVRAAGRRDDALAILRRFGAYDRESRVSQTSGSMQHAGGSHAAHLSDSSHSRSASDMLHSAGETVGNTMSRAAASVTDTARSAASHVGAGMSHSTSGRMSNETLGDDARTVQLREEELHARKSQVEKGEVHVRKEVHTEHRTLEVPVTREEVVIERHPASGSSMPAADIAAGETIRVPVREEEVHVEKTPVVKEEVTIGKRKVTGTARVADTVKKEELRVEKDGDVDMRNR